MIAGHFLNSVEIEAKIKQITSQWFFTEPLLFSVYCTHHLVCNTELTIPMRTGRMCIEFSPTLLEQASENQIEEYLKIEIYRILLGHPYKRQPHNAQKGILYIASDVTIYTLFNLAQNTQIELSGVLYLKNQAVRFHTLTHPLGLKWIDSEELKFYQRNLQIDHKTGSLIPVDDLTLEQWYQRILFLVKETSIAGSESAGNLDSALIPLPTGEASELWEENQDAQDQIKDNIRKAEIDQGWGGLGGNSIRSLKQECDFSFDYRRALTQFRQSIVSANRTLTRMRPSRRYGFKAMGSRYERKANILIAVDVSGSITDESFEHFYHAINNFFFLGLIEKIDLIFFDVNIKNKDPITFHKKINLDEIKGRGGTNFQPAIDFYFDHNSIYNGLIIFTDGEGDLPAIHKKGNILWILDSRIAYEKSKQKLNTLSGCKCTYLPF